MKRIAILIFSLIALVGCDQVLTKHYGGEMTIEVEKGYKVTNATWKEDELWYFIEPMEHDYVPKTKILKEDSVYGIVEGDVIFKESR